jgi:hypothetical protein
MNPRLKTSPDSTSGPNLRPGTPPPPTARPTQTAPAPHTLKPLHTARPTGHRSTDPTPLSPPHTAHPTAHCLTTTHARPPHTARPTQIARLGKKNGKIHTHTHTNPGEGQVHPTASRRLAWRLYSPYKSVLESNRKYLSLPFREGPPSSLQPSPSASFHP